MVVTMRMMMMRQIRIADDNIGGVSLTTIIVIGFWMMRMMVVVMRMMMMRRIWIADDDTGGVSLTTMCSSPFPGRTQHNHSAYFHFSQLFSSSFPQPDFLDWWVSGRQVAPSYRRPHCKTYWKRRSHCTERRIATWILWGPAKTELYCNDHVAIVLDLAMGQEISLILPAVDLKHQYGRKVFMQPSF